MAKTVTHQPLVSVIMPVFNAADFIEAAIESVLHQDYQNLELIIINDGSTDASGAIVKRLEDPRVKYSETTNRGVSEARNTAIKLATGEWLAFLDADDIWLPGKLSAQSRFFDDYDLVCGNAEILGGPDSGKLLMRSADLVAMETRGVLQLIEGTHPPLSSVCLRRTSLGDERFTPGQRFGEDFDLWLRVVADGARIKAIGTAIYKYRVHTTSATAQTVDAAKQAAEVLIQFSRRGDLDPGIVQAAQVSAKNNYYIYCKLRLKTDHYALGSVIELVTKAHEYTASFMKVLIFAIMRQA